MVFFPKTHNPSLIMSKTSDKPKLEGLLEDTWPVLFETTWSDKQGKTEKLSQTRGTEGDVRTKRNVGSWMGSWGRKGMLMRKLRQSKQRLEFGFSVTCEGEITVPCFTNKSRRLRDA